MSECLQPNGLQHTRLPCPSPSPGLVQTHVHWCQWCHPNISAFVTPFSSCPQTFLASGSFPMSQLLISGDQSIGVSVSASVLPMNIYDWFPLGFTGLIPLLSKGLSRVFSSTTVWKHQNISSLTLSLLYGPSLTSVHDYWKNHSFDYMDFCQLSDVSEF